MIHYYDIGHAEVFVFDHFIIKQVKEGQSSDLLNTSELETIVKEHFENKNMVYISNRVNSYSVNPLVYKEFEKIPNLIAIAVVPHSNSMRLSAELESKFFNKPFEIFENLNTAVSWANRIIETTNTQTFPKSS
ncbi:hypothetical protein [Confluentibacter sediminis]|uniref:hypothetical protein n=1 Tax=Confluentibacter sediminis TaxID=2219045 RepID=UPI001F17C92D|nr:hypothetical protein [Confluentibacter sediminis]